MKKILVILLSIFLLTACSNSEPSVQKEENLLSKDEIPKETIDGITEIVLTFVATGQTTTCETCRCWVKSREDEGNGNYLFVMGCSSGNTYWASYCSSTGNVIVAPQYSEHGGITLTSPPPPPCR